MFNFSQDDHPTYCVGGRCQDCLDSQKASLHTAMLKIFNDNLALPDDVDEWGRQKYEREAQEKRRKEVQQQQRKEPLERPKKKEPEKRETRGRERDREQEKERQRERERSRSGRKRVLKSEVRQSAKDEATSFVAQMTEVDLRKMCLELKACGMLEDGINYLYLGDSPEKQAQKAVKELGLSASTVASLAGVKLEKPGDEGAASSSKKRKPPEPTSPPRKFVEEKGSKKKKGEEERKKDEQGDLEKKKHELKEKLKSRNKDDKDEHLDERDLLAKADEPKMKRQVEKMKNELAEKDSLDESEEDDEVPDFGGDEPEDADERPPPVVLRERTDRPRAWTAEYQEYQESWQEDEDDEEPVEEERYESRAEDDWTESRGYDREGSSGKGKGKTKNKSKSKSKGKSKSKYPRRWYEAPKISEENLIQSLIRKGERHQADWDGEPTTEQGNLGQAHCRWQGRRTGL